jgi:hypothetical protein
MGPAVREDRARRLLGVPDDADIRTIRAAYRRLLLHTHPDISGDRDATERTVGLTAAYRSLARAARQDEKRSTRSDERSDDRSEDMAPRGSAATTSESSGHGDDRLGATRPAPDRIGVARIGPDTIGIAAPAEETMLLLVDAADRLGDVGYLDRAGGLLEVVVEFLDAPTSSVVLSLHVRSDGVSEVFCTVEPLSGGDAPTAPAVTKLVLDTLLEARR